MSAARSTRTHKVAGLPLVVAGIGAIVWGAIAGLPPAVSDTNPGSPPSVPHAVVIPPGPDVQGRLQERLIDAVPGDIIQLEAGIYDLTQQLDVAADSITLRGRGSDRTILRFRGQAGGGSGLEATGDNFTLEHLAIEDTAGDGVKVLGSRNVTFRGVRTEWTGPPSAANGAYGIYPVQCTNVLVEECVAIGASDAGLYVGQCRDVVVRRCRAERNVAGIEIENTVAADVHDNVATNNTGGILVFDLPGLPVKNGGDVRVYGNRVVGNNHPNFADPGGIVATVPPGTGVMILATDRVEVFDNAIEGNDSASLLVLSFLSIGRRLDDDAYDPTPADIAIHDNRITAGGRRAQGPVFEMLRPLLGPRTPDILWDGVVSPGAAPRLSIRGNRDAAGGDATYANLRLADLTPEALAAGRYAIDTAAPTLAAALPAVAPVALRPHDPPTPAVPPRVQIYRDMPRKLSEYGLFAGRPAEQRPAADVILYELNTELFSDFSIKRRFIRLPSGETLRYRDAGLLEFPVGTLIAKTFSYPHALPQAGHTPGTDGGERLVETRVEFLRDDGWYGASYVWDDDQADADLSLGGRLVDVAWTDAEGAAHALRYEVPNANQCLTCHAQRQADGRLAYLPVGPTAANLNRRLGAGADDQLSRLVAAGRLAGLSRGAEVERLAAFADPHSGTVAERARAWLHVNCGHCHNPAGSARTSGLDLTLAASEPARWGVWKTPVAAGPGAGGRLYDIVPGRPDESILVHRLESEDPAVMMPSVGRRMVFPEAIAVVRSWIEELPTDVVPR